MKISGEAVLHAPVDRVWEAIHDPEVLVRTIPGCERLEMTGENAYAMTVTAGVASIKGTYAGVCTLDDVAINEALMLRAEGSGAPGTIGVDVEVGLTDLGDGTTKLTYDAIAVVGGMVGGVGQRMLTSVSKRMAGTFFSSINDVLSGVEVPVAAIGAGDASSADAPSTPQPGQSFVAPGRAASGGSEEFVKGVAVGAALVLVGVVAGVIAGRRRG